MKSPVALANGFGAQRGRMVRHHSRAIVLRHINNANLTDMGPFGPRVRTSSACFRSVTRLMYAPAIELVHASVLPEELAPCPCLREFADGCNRTRRDLSSRPQRIKNDLTGPDLFSACSGELTFALRGCVIFRDPDPLACLAVGQSHAGKRAAFSAAHPPADRAGAVRGMGLLAFDIDWNTGILQGILFACVPSLFSVALLVAISQEVCTESYSDFGDANEKARQSRRSTQGIALELCKRGVHVAAVVSAT